ncbi:hypothetical protein BD779DRAFT_1667885 [Infundibulicybe gibba]|nr:hypothetical protein BD779DRAFT_1667885 [Infundibulicybe gibba]
MPPKTTKTTPRRAAVKEGTTAVAGSSKRKAILISDGSVSEVDHTAPLSSPSKKAKFISALPTPGETDFENLPALSIADIVQEALQPLEPSVRRKLSFGSLLPVEEDRLEPPSHCDDKPAGITSPTSRPIRTKIPTEKALFNDRLRKMKTKKATAPVEDDPSISSDSDLPADVFSPPRQQAPVTPPSAPLKVATPSPEVPKPRATTTIRPPGRHFVFPGNPSSSPGASTSPRYMRIRRRPLFKVTTPSPTAGEIPPSVIPPPATNGRHSIRAGKQRAPTPVTLPRSTVPAQTGESDEEAALSEEQVDEPEEQVAEPEEQVAESGEQVAESGEQVAEPGEEGSSSEGQGDDEGEVSGADNEPSPQPTHAAVAQETVMCESMQDPQLYPYYVGLPFLDRVCDVRSYPDGSGESRPDSARADFSALAKVIPQSSVRSLTRGLLFGKCGFFVNTARIHPKLLTNDGGRLKITVDGRLINAVGIMLGVTTECLLSDTGTYGSLNTYNVHRITIAPFKQEWRRDVSVWGKVLGFTLITGSHTHLGVSFTTRKQIGSSSAILQSSDPVSTGTSSILTSVTSPLSATSTNRTLKPYPTSRGFNEQSDILLHPSSIIS